MIHKRKKPAKIEQKTHRKVHHPREGNQPVIEDDQRKELDHDEVQIIFFRNWYFIFSTSSIFSLGITFQASFL
jgi:hypothetical protein